MSGAHLQLEAQGLEAVQARIARLTTFQPHELLDALGAAVASQTKHRIASEKRSPEGTPWAPWSPRYAATRPAGKSLLQDKGHLLDSIQHLPHEHDVEIGSRLVQAAALHFGLQIGIISTHAVINIPPRPFLGLSDGNVDELVGLADDWIDAELVGGAA